MAEDVSVEDIKMGDQENDESVFTSLLNEIIYSPLNIFLLSLCVVLLYKIFKSDAAPPVVVMRPPIPKLKKQDMTLECIMKYDGTGEHGRVCTAVNGKIFDVTRGKRFYGPGGSYSAFAGRDATRALATFKIDDVSTNYDDLSDLTSMQMDSVREWEMQFQEKYEYIGRFLRPGEEPNDYEELNEEEDKEKSLKKDE